MAIADNDRIDGWREIAEYLGRDERTAKRWEKQRGLPVRRIPGDGRPNVYVLRSEVDAWLERGVEGRGSAEPGGIVEPRGEEVGISASFEAGEEPSAEAMPDAGVLSDADLASAADFDDSGTREMAGLDRVPHRSRTVFQPAQHVSLMVSLFGLLLLLTATAIRFFHLGPLESILFASESATTRRSVVGQSSDRDELYLRAVYLCDRRSAASLEQARALFTEAIARGEKDAASHAGLAKTYLLLREYGTMPEAQAYDAARAAAERALALDPQLSDAHAALGFVDFFWDHQPEAAEREFRTAMLARDQSALAHQWYGSMLMHQGRHTEALAQMTIAQQLNPTSTAILANKALAVGFSGRRDEGVRLLEFMQNAGADSAVVHRDLAYLSLISPRDTGRFLTEAKRFAELRQDAPMAAVMRAAQGTFATEGETAMWRTVLREERTFHPDAMHPSYLMAEAEAMLGHDDEALRALEHLSRDRDGGMLGIVLEPAFASLHKDAAFARMAEGMGLVYPATSTR